MSFRNHQRISGQELLVQIFPSDGLHHNSEKSKRAGAKAQIQPQDEQARIPNRVIELSGGYVFM
jgi:hypothetical protein